MRERPGCGHLAPYGEGRVGPDVATASTYGGLPRVLPAEISRGSERTREGRDNKAHGNLLAMPSSLLVLSNS